MVLLFSLLFVFVFLLIVLTSAGFFRFEPYSWLPAAGRWSIILLHPAYSTDQPINNLSHRMELLVSFFSSELANIRYPIPDIRHPNYFLALGRLAPYLLRRCKRLATPAVSNVPRTMW